MAGTGGGPKLKQPRREVALLLDRDLQDELRQAIIAHQRIDDDDGRAKAQAEKVVDDLRAKASKAETLFVFRNLSRDEKRVLREAHPATDEQVAAAKEAGESRPEIDEDTFYPAYLDLACIEPELPEGWFDENAESGALTVGEVGALVQAALAAAMDVMVVDWGKGSNGTRSSRRSSRTASRGESPTASSQAES